MTRLPLPGDYFLSQLSPGLGRTAAELGQFCTGDASRFTHAGMVLDHGEAFEAMPGGARIVPLTQVQERPGLLVYSRWTLSNLDRADIVRTARSLEGTPYFWGDYASLAALNFGVRPEFVRRYAENTGHMICSQATCFALTFSLVSAESGAALRPAVAGQQAPIHSTRGGLVYVPSGRWPFRNRRWTGDVTPGDLTYVQYGPEDT